MVTVERYEVEEWRKSAVCEWCALKGGDDATLLSKDMDEGSLYGRAPICTYSHNAPSLLCCLCVTYL